MRFCVLDENCAVYDRHSKVAGITRSCVICEGCTNRTRSDLNLLRYDFLDLSNALVRSDVRSDAHIFRPKPESSAPLDMQALALRDDIVDVLTAAEDAVREREGDRPRQSRVRDGFAVDQAARYLSERCDTFALTTGVRCPEGLLDGPEVLMLLGRLHRRVRRCVGLLEPVVKVPGSCPRCGCEALRRRDPQRVWCQQCHVSMTKDEYYAACRMLFTTPVTGEHPHRSP